MGGGRLPSANPAALVALAWVHLERHELKQTRSRLKQLRRPRGQPGQTYRGGRLPGSRVWCAGRGTPDMAVQTIARARSGWQVPPWLERKLSLVQSRASVAAGTVPGALADAERAGQLAGGDGHPRPCTVAAGDGDNARRALAPLLAAHSRVPDRVRLQACLVDARLSYHSGDGHEAGGHWDPRCGWPNVSNSGCRSRWRAVGSSRYSGVTLNWPAATGSAAAAPAPRSVPGSPGPVEAAVPSRSSRSPNANGRCWDTCRAC